MTRLILSPLEVNFRKVRPLGTPPQTPAKALIIVPGQGNKPVNIPPKPLIGLDLPDHDVRLVKSKLSQPVYHYEAGQPLMFDEGLVSALLVDIRDSFFWSRHRGAITAMPQEWRKSFAFFVHELLQFTASIQQGKASDSDVNGIPKSATILNGTPEMFVFRVFNEMLAIQSHADGRLGGVERTLHNDLITLLTYFGQCLGNVQAVGEDEQQKQAIMLLLGAILAFSEEAHGIAAQERAWGPLRVQDCQKYIATVDLVWPAMRRVMGEVLYGHILNRQLTTFSEGHIYELLMQSLWYFIGQAENQRRSATRTFIWSMGYALPIPVDMAAFLDAFFLKWFFETGIYNLARLSQMHGFKHAMVLSPAKELVFLAESRRAIERLFPEGWEFGPFVASRGTAGQGKMDAYSHNALKYQNVNESISMALGLLQFGLLSGLEGSGGAALGLGINVFWASYSYFLTSKARKMKNELENIGLLMANWDGQLPPLVLSTPEAVELEGTGLNQRTAELISWHAQAQRALKELPATVEKFSRENRATLQAICDRLRYESVGNDKGPSGGNKAPDDKDFLTARLRQSILEFLQMADTGLYHCAMEEIRNQRQDMGYALLKFLQYQSHDYSSFYLASREVKKLQREENQPNQSRADIYLANIYTLVGNSLKAEDPDAKIKDTINSLQSGDDLGNQQKIDDLLALLARPYHQQPAILSGVTDNKGKPEPEKIGLKRALEGLNDVLCSRQVMSKYARNIIKAAPGNYPVRVILRTLLDRDPSLAAKIVDLIEIEQARLGVTTPPNILDKLRTGLEELGGDPIPPTNPIWGTWRLKEMEKLMHDVAYLAQENIGKEPLQELEAISTALKTDLASLADSIIANVGRNEAGLGDAVVLARRLDTAFGGERSRSLEKHIDPLMEKSLNEAAQAAKDQNNVGELNKLLATIDKRRSFILAVLDEKYREVESKRAATFGEKTLGRLIKAVPFDHQFNLESCSEHVKERDKIEQKFLNARRLLFTKIDAAIKLELDQLNGKFQAADWPERIKLLAQYRALFKTVHDLGLVDLIDSVEGNLRESIDRASLDITNNTNAAFRDAESTLQAVRQNPADEAARTKADEALAKIKTIVENAADLGIANPRLAELNQALEKAYADLPKKP